MAYIEIKNLKKVFELGEYNIIAVDDVSLDVEEKEFIVIQGASGAGKTTLLNVIATLEKPTTGSVMVGGINTAVMKEDQLAAWRAVNLGFVFQSFNLISTLTASENIGFPAIFWDYEKVLIDEKVQNLLQIIDLNDRQDHLPFQLSAGEQQRVAIARALVNDPPLVVADEPTANLDANTALKIIDIFARIKEDNEKTVIIASHDERMVKLADRSFVMSAGKLTRSI